MRILASADHHFDHRSRFDECIAVHQWMVELARDQKADLFLSGGDIYDRNSTPEERDAFADFAAPMADVCPLLISRGNHERNLDIEFMARLKTKHPLIVESRASVHYLGDAAIAAIAWPRADYMASVADSLEEANAGVREGLQAVFRGLGHELAQHDGPRIGLGHLMIDGAKASTNQPLLGQPLNVSLSDLSLIGAHWGVAGHIHKEQEWLVDGALWQFAGSPYRTDYSQLERKVVLLAEFDGSRLVGVEKIDTPCAAMVHIDAHWHEGAFLPFEEPPAVAEIRLRYHVATDQQDGAIAEAARLKRRWLEAGAIDVKVERRLIVEVRERMPEVSRAKTDREKIIALWSATNFDPGDRREALLDKFETLETETETTKHAA